MAMKGYLDEYEKLVIRMNTPSYRSDFDCDSGGGGADGKNINRSSHREVKDENQVQKVKLKLFSFRVDSSRRNGILLEAVQILTDLNLSIKKAYISSDGKWNMDVFHVTDINGSKLNDQSVLGYIEQSIQTVYYGESIEVNGLTTLELTGADRVGLLSEMFAVLSDLNCNVVDAKVWTHNGRVASIVSIKDYISGCPVQDSHRISRIEARLRHVLKGDNGVARTCVSIDLTHTERRLHQLMFEDRDYERRPHDKYPVVVVTVQNWAERSYSVVNVQCKDRRKLLFDVVCTLTDMAYVVFHATVNTASDQAYLEFCIRHKDGSPISSEPERQRVIECLQAAVERRASKGVRMELRQPDRQGLLAEVTRTFRENGLNVTRTEISTSNDMATNIFYVTDADGNEAKPKLIESVRAKIGFESLSVKEIPYVVHKKGDEEGEQPKKAVLVSLGSLVWRHLFNFGLI